jgi:hypothetical protein
MEVMDQGHKRIVCTVPENACGESHGLLQMSIDGTEMPVVADRNGHFAHLARFVLLHRRVPMSAYARSAASTL